MVKSDKITVHVTSALCDPFCSTSVSQVSAIGSIQSKKK